MSATRSVTSSLLQPAWHKRKYSLPHPSLCIHFSGVSEALGHTNLSALAERRKRMRKRKKRRRKKRKRTRKRMRKVCIVLVIVIAIVMVVVRVIVQLLFTELNYN